MLHRYHTVTPRARPALHTLDVRVCVLVASVMSSCLQLYGL